jgi:DNA polymerase-3 subunit gamma/tau
MAGDTPGTAHENQPSAGSARAPLALYRRYRPATFAEVKGQEHVTDPLRQALRNGRVNHAYLFSGPRGCGKTSSARILARSLNCVQGPTPDPCGVCDSCVALAPAGPGSIDVIEIDAASHGGVDDARDLRERAFYAPVSGRFKIYIIDEAHMVTREGFNALLKLVEEPPSHLKFVFATTEPEKVIATIRSRTHHYPFRLVPPGVLRDLLEEILAAEGVTYQPSVLPLVVRAGAGSVRDALSVLDQLIAGAGEEGLVYDKTVALLGYSDDSLLDAVVDAFATGDGGAAFGTVDQVVQSGHDPRRFAADLLDRLRDLIILAAVPGAGKAGLLDAPADRLERMADQAERFGQAELARAAEILSDGLIQMRGTTSPRLLLELMCAQVLLPGAGTGERALLVRLERLEHRLEAGGDGTSQRETGQPRSQPRTRAADDDEQDTAHGPQGEGRQATPPQQAAPSSHHAPAQQQAAAQQAPAPQQAPKPHGAGGAVDVDVVRERWQQILDAVLAERRVAWMLLRSATVQSLEGNLLVVGFAREGEVKGFSSSGCDKVLANAMNTVLGINVRVRAMVASEAAVPSARPAPAGPSSHPMPASEAPAPQAPASQPPANGAPAPSPSPAPDPSAESSSRAASARPAPGRNAPGPGPGTASEDTSDQATGKPGPSQRSGERAPAADDGAPASEARGRARATAAAARGRTTKKAPSSGGKASGKQAKPPSQAVGSAFADEEWPDDGGQDGGPAAPADSPTGMELIQRQLGGKVIEEIEEA